MAKISASSKQTTKRSAPAFSKPVRSSGTTKKAQKSKVKHSATLPASVDDDFDPFNGGSPDETDDENSSFDAHSVTLSASVDDDLDPFDGGSPDGTDNEESSFGTAKPGSHKAIKQEETDGQQVDVEDGSTVEESSTTQPTAGGTKDSSTAEATKNGGTMGKHKLKGTADSERPAKRSKQADPLELQLDPTLRPTYLPRTLTAPNTESSNLLTTIYIQSGSDTFKVLSSTTEAEDATSFWKMLNKELEFVQARGSKEGIGFTSRGEVRLLQLASDLMPTLLGQDGRLRYTDAKDLRINKEDYKNYLDTIQANLTELLGNYREDEQAATLADPLSKTMVARQLQRGNRSTQTVTIEEHSVLMPSQANLFNATSNVMRKELSSYAITVSRLAQKVKVHRKEIIALAGYIRKLLGKALGASSSTEDNQATLPGFILEAVPAHPCRCTSCDSEYLEQVEQQATLAAAKSYEDKQTDEARQSLLQKYADEHATELRAEAHRGVVEQMRSEIQAEELQKYKDKLRTEIQDELKQQTRAELTRDIEALYAERSREATKNFQAAMASIERNLV